jgi:hypothetical protein
MNWIEIQANMLGINWDRVAMNVAINDLNNHYDIVLEVV